MGEEGDRVPWHRIIAQSALVFISIFLWHPDHCEPRPRSSSAKLMVTPAPATCGVLFSRGKGPFPRQGGAHPRWCQVDRCGGTWPT